MNFKKDYINYVLHGVISSGAGTFNDKIALRKVLEKIISSDDIVKTTFLIGKTAGLEFLYKYMLYISDKIDKSQITIFNLRNNFDYDVQNLKRIFGKITVNVDSAVKRDVKSVTVEVPKPEPLQEEIKPEQPEEKTKEPEVAGTETAEPVVPPGELSEEPETVEEMTLIENEESVPAGSEVFELSDITESLDRSQEESAVIEVQEPVESRETIEDNEVTENVIEETPVRQDIEQDTGIETPVIEEKPLAAPRVERMEPPKEEPVANEVYYKFETRFFEEVKILEKLFSSIAGAVLKRGLNRVNEKMLQSFTEIIEISSELSDLSRQLSLDITADVFFTINLFFTRAIKSPAIIRKESMELFITSLSLVNCLIKGENYLEYDQVVENIELIRNELLKPAPVVLPQKETPLQKPVVEDKRKAEEKLPVEPKPESEPSGYPKTFMPRLAVRSDKETEAVSFKMKYLVKEFEKEFHGLADISGEYSKFDALEKIDELNKYLRIIAKISYESNMEDILKLSEVSYVFLKYLKDYRMELMEPEIQQIIKYIIFTFKMLLTDRKPEDFNVLVQYLNNPVKIFTDT